MKQFFKPTIAVAVLLAVVPSAFAQQPPGPEVQPGSETPRGDVTRTAPGTTPATGIKPPIGGRRTQSGGDGTQTEDELYVGRKAGQTPLGEAPVRLPGSAPAIGNKPPPSISGQRGPSMPPRRAGRDSGDEDDIDDQEIERRTVQGVSKPGVSQDRTVPGTAPAVGHKPPPSVGSQRGTALPPSSIRGPIDRSGAIVIPRENCGTFWTQWGKDPKADSNPCPANCERGERLNARERKTDSGMQYQANYRCNLPELAIKQPPAASREPGAPPRRNCGTFWTKRQSDPNNDANPCPANCERGELLDVRRGRSGDKLHYEMNYRCYVAELAKTRTVSGVAPGSNKVTGSVMEQPPTGSTSPPPATSGPLATVPQSEAGARLEQPKNASTPVGPELISVKPLSMFAIKGEWKPVAGAKSYVVKAMELHRSRTESSPEYPGNAMSPLMNGGVAGLVPGFSYDVWIEARYPDGRVGTSTVRRTSTVDPVNPSGLTATLTGSGAVRLDWTPVRGAVHYLVEGSQVAGRLQVQDAAFTVNNVPAGHHEWRVIAVYGQGVFNDVRPAVVALVLQSAAGNELGTAANSETNPLKSIGGGIHDPGQTAGGTMKDVGKDVGKAIKEGMNRTGTAVKQAASKFGETAKKLWNAIGDLFR